jgi:hypothetical protein
MKNFPIVNRKIEIFLKYFYKGVFLSSMDWYLDKRQSTDRNNPNRCFAFKEGYKNGADGAEF